MRETLLLVFALMLSCSLMAQEDSLQLQEADTSHSVRKATLLSTCLPGAGQIYNHLAKPKGKRYAFVKVPLIYAGLGATGFMIYSRQAEVISLKKEYRLREQGLAGDPQYSAYDQQGIVTLYNGAARGRDLSIIAFILVYGFQVADAAVEAHFVNFDVSEDLSLSIRPRYFGSTSYGVGLSFQFH